MVTRAIQFCQEKGIDYLHSAADLSMATEDWRKSPLTWHLNQGFEPITRSQWLERGLHTYRDESSVQFMRKAVPQA